MASVSSRLAAHVSRKRTPQSEQADPRQAPNNAGGFTFVVDDWKRLDRFLILGTDGGTYYVSERKLTKDNAACVGRCLAADYKRTIDQIVAVSEAGRAPKNGPAVFALALAASADQPEARSYALSMLSRVCRIGTDLFAFAAVCNELRGWGRGLRKGIGTWYSGKTPDQLAYQLIKYQQRDGWSHRDLLRLAHVEHSDLLRYVVSGAEFGERVVERKLKTEKVSKTYAAVDPSTLPALVQAYEEMKRATDVKDVIRLVREHRMTREMVPTQWLNDVAVWDALLATMPMTAMIRNLGKMTSVGLLAPLSDGVAQVCSKLGNESALKKARVHPIGLLAALHVYGQGKGVRGKLTWSPDPRIASALDAAFHLSFQTIVPTGKKLLLALDVSGSMSSSPCGMTGITAAMAAAAMCMVTARTESEYHIMGFADSFRDLKITPHMSLQEVMERTAISNFGTTDCGQPMRWARKNKVPCDGFVVYTDNETYAGDVHPFQELKAYRQQMGRDAKEVVVGMTTTECSIADPSDAGSLDVVGFDTATPNVIADFLRGDAAPEEGGSEPVEDASSDDE
jgi:60 kDa SS-A/Ro ribonucleoprotein